MLQRILGCAKFMLRALKISDFRGMSIPAGLWERKENVHLRPVAQTALFFPRGCDLCGQLYLLLSRR